MGEDWNWAGPISESAVARLMQKVRAELDRGRGVQAVRLFADGLDHGIAPAGANLVTWLVKVLGKPCTAKLVEAYAKHPCFYCQKGLEPCEACKGVGHSQDNTLCEACVTTGLARCDFCNGSGLVTFNAMPADLRLLAALERVKLAVAAGKALLGRAAPRPDPNQPHECWKRCAKRLLDVNRLMGIFENAVILVGSVFGSASESRSVQLRILRACARFAPAAREQLRAILQCMSACARFEMKDSKPAASRRDLAQKRVAFLDLLLETSSRFSGTALEHPFLFAKLDELMQKPAGDPDPPSKPRLKGR